MLFFYCRSRYFNNVQIKFNVEKEFQIWENLDESNIYNCRTVRRKKGNK